MELQRNFNLMRDLDSRSQGMVDANYDVITMRMYGKRLLSRSIYLHIKVQK